MAEEKIKKKKMNPFLTIIFAFILPLIVALVLAVILLSFLGVDLAGWTEDKLAKTPIVSSFVKTEDEKSLMAKLEKADETINIQKEMIEELEGEIEQLEGQIDNMEIEMAKLENESTEENEKDLTDLEEDVDIKKLASSFRKMEKEQAANIVSNLSVTTAVILLSNVSPDVRGEILEAMEPQAAANLMENMME
ncbi:MAG TPA: hypothetical protein VFF20_06225 [Pseudogracilibacillus sp.]|nr:hypothetical protein [Pseudogracilibacillus sp.]